MPKKSAKPPLILKGSRRDLVVEGIRQGRLLGGNTEGSISTVHVTLRAGNTRKTIELAEKTFKPKKNWPGLHHLRDPVAQFKTMSGLLELNRKKRLGLHILPTIRLREMGDGSHRIILTKFTKFNPGTATERELEKAKKIRIRDADLLSRNGYVLGGDCFSLIKDPTTGKPRWFITDFGVVVKVK